MEGKKVIFYDMKKINSMLYKNAHLKNYKYGYINIGERRLTS